MRSEDVNQTSGGRSSEKPPGLASRLLPAFVWNEARNDEMLTFTPLADLYLQKIGFKTLACLVPEEEEGFGCYFASAGWTLRDCVIVIALLYEMIAPLRSTPHPLRPLWSKCTDSPPSEMKFPVIQPPSVDARLPTARELLPDGYGGRRTAGLEGTTRGLSVESLRVSHYAIPGPMWPTPQIRPFRIPDRIPADVN